MDEGSDRAVRLLVDGRVQGVGYRHFIRRVAEELGVVGFVRNLPGGGVEIRAEGEAAAIEQLIDAARRGPRWSSVERIDRSDETPSRAFPRFEVRF